MSVNYRPEIDGLRAISVLGVIFYHFSPYLLQGGFIGVDIFFVISGYLITSIIRREFKENKFSYLNFYSRRMKRILPAFFSVIFFTVLCVYFLMSPEHTLDFSKSMIASGMFFSNFYFYNAHEDYFFHSDYVPLLNMWSLSIEEQFYLVFPVFVILFSKRSARALMMALFAVLLTSVLLSEISVLNGKTQEAFYLTPLRMSPLLLGSIVAILNERGLKLDRKLMSLLSSVGIVIIFGSFVVVQTYGFSAIEQMIVGGATCLILYNHEDNLVNKILSYKPLVEIGKMSFSLYLFHWPILSFISYLRYSGNYLSFGLMFTFILSYWNYKDVEQRYRYVDYSFNTLLKKYFLFPILFIFLIHFHINYTSGWKFRFPNFHQIKFDKLIEQKSIKFGFNGKPDLANYIWKQGDKEKTFILIGDSHARHFYYFLYQIGIKAKVNIIAFTIGDCSPGLTSEHEYKSVGTDKCDYIYKKLNESTDSYDGVILAGYYTDKPSISNYSSSFKSFMNDQIEKKKKVIVMSQIPSFETDATTFRAEAAERFGLAEELVSELNPDYKKANEWIREITSSSGGTFINLDSLFFDGDKFSAYTDTGEFYYRDSNHIRDFAAFYLAQKVISDEQYSFILEAFSKP